MEGSGIERFLAQNPPPAKLAAGAGVALLDACFARTLDRLVEALGREAPGTVAEAWLFEDEAPRRRAEARLAERGVRARFRSAYKPLIHACLEEFALDGLREARITYPVEDEADGSRFRLEAYPLGAMIGGARLRFRPGGPGLTYRVALTYADDRVVRHRVFAPNRVRDDPAGLPSLSPCGWLRVTGGETFDGPVETDVEAAFRAVLGAVEACPVAGEGPCLERLLVDLACPGIERPLGRAGPAMSLAEALHEDITFAAHEVLARRCGRAPGDRGFQPGQVVPVVAGHPSEVRARVVVGPHERAPGGRGVRPGQAVPVAAGHPSEMGARVASAPHERAPEASGWEGALDQAEEAPSLDRIGAEVAALGGEGFEAWSVQGRRVAGTVVAGPGPAVLVTAAQHGNETSGVVGLLRAARRLAGRAHLALIPVENPDGYALHRALCRDQPDHIHHAARFTALGDDLEARSAPLFEAAARAEALRRTGARLHVNLHGYPAHEWTRPFSGYVPRGFAAWTIPRGFFLILRHHPGWAAPAASLADAVARALRRLPGLLALNRAQIALGRTHGSPPPGRVRHGIPCLLAEEARGPVPVTLITEFPDETVTGEAFRLAHEVQMRAVLAAVEHWQVLGSGA